MKRFLTLLFTMVCFVTLFAKGPSMKFTETVYSFGNIKEADGKVTHEFEFVNDGDEPLVIYTCVATCGCTTPKYPTEPVKPGEKGVISVTYDPTNRPGEFSKKVKVRHSGNPSLTNLRINGVVLPK